MARAHFVNKARKDNPVAKKGESYYWWQLHRGPKQYSKTHPKASQLTGSAFLSAAYSIGEQAGEFDLSTEDWKDEAASLIEDLVSQIDELRDMAQESFDNMPEGLQQGDTGQLLEGRVECCEDWSARVEAVDPEEYEDVELWWEELTCETDYEGE
jgi:hypothetical protein